MSALLAVLVCQTVPNLFIGIAISMLPLLTEAPDRTWPSWAACRPRPASTATWSDIPRNQLASGVVVPRVGAA
jgi:hypothetical protein